MIQYEFRNPTAIGRTLENLDLSICSLKCYTEYALHGEGKLDPDYVLELTQVIDDCYFNFIDQVTRTK